MHRSAWITGLLVATLPTIAVADEFAAGSLIIPMDTDYQDMGMLRAYGLVYELLRQNVTVHWVIKTGKQIGDPDFMTSASDLQTGAAIDEHGYRGGPWVIDAADADLAMPVIEAWQISNPETAVHEATAAFSGDISHTLVVAPTIAMMADGNQKIARKYMMAAGIPDSTGDLGWPDSSPDMLDPVELSGPDPVGNHHDGALFDADGDPVYCQFMSMHWGVKDAEANPGVVAEMREFLTYPTHFFAECQAVNAFENLDPHGYFLTQKGFAIGAQPKLYDYFQSDTAYAQLDGPFLSVGGSEPSYSLLPGEMYKSTDVVMITAADTPVGVQDVWMTGFLDGLCPGLQEQPGLSAACLTAGKISYLGGHEYDVNLPISTSPTTQGTRLFLNSLFEAPCSSAEGLPQPVITKTAPAVAVDPQVTFDIEVTNEGALPALDAVIVDTLPPGVTFVSATDDGVEANGIVTWTLGNLGDGEARTVHVTVTLGADGIYANTATLNYRAGVNLLTLDSNQTKTAYGVEPTTGDPTSGTGGNSGTGTATATGDPTGNVPTTGGGSGPAGSSGADASGEGSFGEVVDSGCGCRGSGRDPTAPALLLGLALLARRRRIRG